MGTRSKPTPTARNRKSVPARTSARRQITPNLLTWSGIETAPRSATITPQKLTMFANALWRACDDARGRMLVEMFFASRGLILPDDIDSDVVRFHSALKFNDDRAPGLVWLLRCAHNDQPVGVVRMFLDVDGALIGQRVLGRAWGAAIKLDADENVSSGLHVAVGVENALAVMMQSVRPVWAVTSTNALADLSVMNGIEALTIITDDTNAQAIEAVSERWRGAGREVLHVQQPRPP